MDVILRIGTAGRLIDFGIATTRTERSAVMAQRFRVYQRHGYYRPGLKADRDEYDRRAVSFLARVDGGDGRGVIVGSARLIVGATRPGFRFPTEKAFRLELPSAVRAIPVSKRVEVGRLVAERPEGIPLSGLLVPLGLIQAISLYARPRGIRCGLAGVKRRLLLALRGTGLPFRDLPHAGITYPRRGALAGYFRHPDPVVPVYWLAEEMPPAVAKVVLR